MNTALDLRVASEKPQTLTDKDFEELNEVTQDMWAYGIGELVKCNDCGEIHSKEDIFGHLPEDIKIMTVSKILDILDIEDISCPTCGWDTRYIYGKGNVENIRDHLLNSDDSFLVTCRDENDKIVGYVDGYVSSLETIFRRELHYHYSQVWFEEVRNRVENVLGFVPPRLISFSSMWLTQRHASFYAIFEMLRVYFLSFPEKRASMQGIIEADIGSNCHKIYASMKGESLGIAKDPTLRNKITETGRNYRSDLLVFKNPIPNAVQGFSWGARGYLKLLRSDKKPKTATSVTLA